MTFVKFSRTIDLNADLGEYSGSSGAASDDAILDLVSSANIACGAHAGDEEVMKRTVEAATRRGVSIGAHPGYPDREGFGRREMTLAPAALREEIIEQIELLATVCGRAGARMRYVKPHGALYNAGARDRAIAAVIAESVSTIDPKLVLLGLDGSELLREGTLAGLTVASEAFADRVYLSDGTLLPRDRAGAVLHDAESVAARSLAMVSDHYVNAVDGTRLIIHPDSLCVHGDNPDALWLISGTKSALEKAGFMIRPFAE